MTIPEVLSAIESALTLMAGSSELRLIFPGLAGSNTSWALSQWAHCGVLGMPLAALHNAALDAALPYPPELCGWAQANLGLSQAEAGISTAAAQARTLLAASIALIP